MHQYRVITRQGRPVRRVSAATARRYFNEGKAIGVTEAFALCRDDPDIFKADGDPMQWPCYNTFEQLANEMNYYATNHAWWWVFDNESGLAE